MIYPSTTAIYVACAALFAPPFLGPSDHPSLELWGSTGPLHGRKDERHTGGPSAPLGSTDSLAGSPAVSDPTEGKSLPKDGPALQNVEWDPFTQALFVSFCLLFDGLLGYFFPPTLPICPGGVGTSFIAIRSHMRRFRSRSVHGSSAGADTGARGRSLHQTAGGRSRPSFLVLCPSAVSQSAGRSSTSGPSSSATYSAERT